MEVLCERSVVSTKPALVYSPEYLSSSNVGGVRGGQSNSEENCSLCMFGGSYISNLDSQKFHC